jgi:hypothetical protein
MTDTYDDLDDLDKVWAQDDSSLSRDVEVDLGLDDRPVFDDDPVVDDRPEVLEEIATYAEFDDEENVVALHGHDRFRSGRFSRRKTATLLHASTITIGVGIGAIGVTLTPVILPGYRAGAPPGADLALYPREYLLRAPSLRFWETFAMEWNVHVGWITPSLATAVAFVAVRYGKRLVADFQVRKTLINLFVIAFAASCSCVAAEPAPGIAERSQFMTRKTKAVTAVMAVAAIAALFAAPSAFAQQSGGGYGEDVYGGTQSQAPQTPADSTLAKKAASSWTMLRTKLTGEVEVPRGDPNASGTASVKVSDSQVCFDVQWSGIKATASHIHLAPKGRAGAIVVPFFKSDTPLGATRKQGCTEVSATLAKAIASNPGAYYVNVHDTPFPKGAIRGQLTKDSGGGSQLPYTGGNRSRGLLLLSLSVVIAGSMLLAAGQRRGRPVHARR